jgi:hypothetical protein
MIYPNANLKHIALWYGLIIVIVSLGISFAILTGQNSDEIKTLMTTAVNLFLIIDYMIMLVVLRREQKRRTALAR